ncbi:MAG: helix-turn-helix domain-containing protein [Lachnospiraceae bacterium]|nr:helix-turn-helix domain-containing protein [Lachnospiraceae bacterium]
MLLRRKTRVKKTGSDVDNHPEYSEQCGQLYRDIKEHLAAGYSKREISKKLHCSRNTVSKYAEGDYEALCRKVYRSRVDQHYDMIVKSLSAGMSRADVYQELVAAGCQISKTAAYDYMNKLIKGNGIDVSVYKSSSPEAVRERKRLEKYDHVTRPGIFRFLWMGGNLTPYHREYLMKEYPVLSELAVCIREFREIFDKRNMPMLYLFIEKYKSSQYKGLSRFAAGLEKDIEAVENAVASDLSNGFVREQTAN